MEIKKTFWHTLTNFSALKKPDSLVVFFPATDGHITAIVDTSTFVRYVKYSKHTQYMFYEDLDMYAKIINFQEGTAEQFVNTFYDLY